MQQLDYRETSVLEWADKHHVHHELLPFKHRERNTIHSAIELGNQLKSWPKTKQTWTVEQTQINSDEIRGKNKTEHIPIPYFLGCYPIETHRKARWTNPYYVHSIQHTPYVELPRGEFYRMCAEIGRFSLHDVGEMFNVTKQAVRGYLTTRGYSWAELRAKGKRRFARTMETINKWIGIDFALLARVFNVNRTTLCNWRSDITEPIPKHTEFIK